MPDRNSVAPLLTRMSRIMNSAGVRLLLSAAIIFSLIPEPWVKRYEPVLLGLFALEFSLRLVLALRRETDDDPRQRGWRWPRPGALALLALDLIALVSFLPIDPRASPWMRSLRLLRFAVLLGYWAPLMRDLRTVMLRRERARQVVVMAMIVGLLTFAGALMLQQSEFDDRGVDYDENGQVDRADRDFFTKLWWAFRQIQDPGNMMTAPTATSVVFVSLWLTVAGLFLVSFLIGLGSDVVREMMELSQLRPPGMHGHTVIVNITAATQQLLEELMRYYQKLLPRDVKPLSRWWFGLLLENLRRALAGPRYVVVGTSPERPDFLRRSDLARIVYRHGSATDEAFMHRADIAVAQRVVLLADTAADEPDAETIRASLAIVEGLRDPSPAHPDEGAVTGSNIQVQRNRSKQTARVTDGHLTHQRGRGKLLIAEILDERNVPAAWAALASGGGELRAFIVVVDRMIALFLACVGRSAGIGPLLAELLTCTGHEIYTCFFDLPELSYACETPPQLPHEPRAAMDRLTRRARALPPHQRLVPIGLLYEETDDLGMPDLGVVIGGDERAEGAQSPTCSGFVALAPSFAHVRQFSEDLRHRPDATTWSEDQEAAARRTAADAPEFTREPHLPLRRVLICGFRPVTIALCEALILAEPDADVLVLVPTEAERRAALDRINVHRDMVQRRLLRGYHGALAPRPEGDFSHHYEPRGGGPPIGRVRIVVGDATSPLQFVDLPGGSGHVSQYDLVYILSSAGQDSDARGAQTLMTLDALLSRNEPVAPHLRIVAEFVDAELAHRLRQRYAALGVSRVQVYSTENLRAYFLFQSVLIPGFARVYGQLLAPWGHSFARVLPSGRGRGRCSFQALSLHIAAAGHGVLIGIELDREGGGADLHLGGGPPGGDGLVDLARVRGLWVVTLDPAVHPADLRDAL
ncbi:hypothetical protein [Nannocystis sp. SCPEA4]|uniref:hypothetical protein n=1 Tax=Nannocystis sp. SCPEA4 TaxID=2996787 RepID=UPI00226FCD26|nr:hypothetical protein [Nannocystis sp. SCPEA4]MCY1058692.1 hypothetical protein [Nannocystis sp. SCPEA4]